ncbi:mucosa-associated lymphoid tissue lymphoma translocation protein 1 homolog [Linepithema humile]|uniref:mucosa-associated lymphoid tissue lymphoma translocation protein 1 homolog n=1 Tax=Linepithema humile TaxID=83485 RepID=UPI0006239224|nr:PREDICTED: mucosa-associated lymphoid tissue lymphoma translocation protein 1 homolog [Linepithema humile]
MAKIDENLYLDEVSPAIYKELICELNKNSNWQVLACHVAEQLEDQRNSWLRSLEQNMSTTKTPADNLLFELNVKMCTVRVLCTLLRECELGNVLSVLHHPEPSIIVKHPSDGIENDTLEISLGQHLRLSCKATGIPPPTYQWYHNNIELQEQQSHELDITINSCDQAGEYKCKISQITNDGEEVIFPLQTKSVFVNISHVPVIILQQPPAFLEIKEGDEFTLKCIAHGYPKPCYQWFRDNTRLEGETSNILHIKHFSSKYEGKYHCYINNNVNEVITQRSHVMMDLPREKAVAKIALIIANDDYENHKCLETPKNDAAKIGNLLKEIGFKVICLANLSLEQMRNTMKIFSEVLTEGVYGLFHYAGHGFKMQESYMLAVDAPESYLRKDAICESELLAMLLQNDPALLVTILDMCQTVPPKERNPDIHNEIPKVKEYKSRKNLRNLVQAYSTSSHRPSYERTNSKYGLYAIHLSKYINKNIPVTKVFEEVGKSIDTLLKGTERNQIPMFALTITKPFYLTDAIYKKDPSPALNHFNKLIAFSTKSFEISFKQAGISAKATISLFMEPYLNIIKISMRNLESMEAHFFNSVPTKRNNLFQTTSLKQECWIHNPQICQGPLVISISKNDTPIGATLLHIKNYIPLILESINN